MKNLTQHSGVALIQVLLISFMLILLTVQLSKESRDQVRIAIGLKKKAAHTVTALSQLEHSQFVLLTQEKAAFVSWDNEHKVGFYGDSSSVGNDTWVTFQDEAGLLSLPYPGRFLIALTGDSERVKQVLQWQGTSSEATRGYVGRGNFMPNLNELTLLPGWQEISTQGLTHLPASYFSLASSPDSLLDQLFPEQSRRIRDARSNGELDRSMLKAILGQTYPEIEYYMPGDITRVSLRVGKDMGIVRHRKFIVAPGNNTPIIDLGY